MKNLTILLVALCLFVWLSAGAPRTAMAVNYTVSLVVNWELVEWHDISPWVTFYDSNNLPLTDPMQLPVTDQWDFWEHTYNNQPACATSAHIAWLKGDPEYYAWLESSPTTVPIAQLVADVTLHCSPGPLR